MVKISRSILPMLFLLLVSLTSCHVARYFYWNFSDLDDDKKFPSVPIRHGPEVFHFHQLAEPLVPALPASLQSHKTPSFEAFLEKTKTVSFLLIRNDTILFECYRDGYNDRTPVPSFSVSKSFVSALVGIALAEGKIKSLDQAVSEYLPELQDTGFKHVRIRDLLNMRAGLKFKESYNSPFALMPKYYYGLDLKKYARALKIASVADQRYEYQSANTLLISLILEKATGQGIARYLEEKIWQALGMESDASWSVDSRKHQTVKSFCCLNAVSRDFARFGRLYLKEGNWDGVQVVPRAWIAETRTIRNDSRDSQSYPYTYHWRVTETGAMFAKGVLGQYIYLDPAKQLIMVRLGKTSANLDWPEFFRKISESL